jgi:hypothetical protein
MAILAGAHSAGISPGRTTALHLRAAASINDARSRFAYAGDDGSAHEITAREAEHLSTKFNVANSVRPVHRVALRLSDAR